MNCPFLYTKTQIKEVQGKEDSDVKIIKNCRILKIAGGPYSKRCYYTENNFKNCPFLQRRKENVKTKKG